MKMRHTSGGRCVGLTGVGLAALMAASAGQAAVVTWGVDVSGEWHLAGNWTPGLPGVNDDVTIDRPAVNILVTVSQGAQSIRSLMSAERLTVTGGASLSVAQASMISNTFTLADGVLGGAGDFTANGATSWTGGEMNGSGRFIVGSGGSFSMSGTGTKFMRKTIENHSANAEWTGGTWFFENANFENMAGATFTAAGSNLGPIGGSSNAINNAGTFNKTGSSDLFLNNGVAINNSGTLNIQGGSLQVFGGGSNTGAINVNAGSTLFFGTNFTHGVGSTISGAGNVRFHFSNHSISDGFTATGNVELFLANVTVGSSFDSSGVLVNNSTLTVNANQDWGSLALTNFPSLGGTGDITVSGATSWSDGQVTGGGKLSAMGGLTLTGGTKTLARVLENGGAGSWNSGTLFFQNATLRNLASGTFDISASTAGPIAGTNKIENLGTLNKTSGSELTVNPGITFDNSGTTNVLEGTLTLFGGGTNSGTIHVADGALLQLGAAYTHGISSTIMGEGGVTFAGGNHDVQGVFSASGPVRLTFGSATISTSFDAESVLVRTGSMTVNANQEWGGLTVDNFATLNGAGSFDVSGPFVWASGTIGGGGSLNTSGSVNMNGDTKTLARSLHIGGSGTWSSGALFFQNASLNIDAGGVLDVSAPTAGAVAGSNSIAVAGTLIKSGGSTFVVNPGIAFSNTGTVDVTGGTMSLLGGVQQTAGTTLTAGTWKVRDGATLSVSNTGYVANNATIELHGANSNFNAIAQLSSNNGTLRLNDGRAFSFQTVSENFFNAGTFVKGGTGTTNVTTNSVLQNTGTFRVESGEFRTPNGFNSSGVVDVRSGALLTLNGGYSQSGSGTLRVEVGVGAPADGSGASVVVTGNAALAGTLEVQLAGGFEPIWGDAFTIMEYTTKTGSFAEVVTPELSDPLMRWWKSAGSSAYTVGVRHVADTNRDGHVDFIDLNNVLGDFGMSGMSLSGDADENGVVNFLDLNFVLGAFGQSAPARAVPAPGAAALLALGAGVMGRRRRTA
ncbi:MAG: hypothetical protein AB7G17_05835 [Phycisphaerales bacterium]